MSCRFQVKWLQAVCCRFHGCCTEREPPGQHSYTWERKYDMLPLKAKEAAFQGR
jgi:hypothetical protein